MSEHNYKYTNEQLNLGDAANYILLLQVDQHNFSYAVTEGKKLMAWAENCPLSELSNPKSLREILTAPYKEVVTGLTAGGFTLMPEALFDNEYAANVARLLDVTETDKVFAQPLDGKNTIIYKVDETVGTPHDTFANEKLIYRAKGWITAIANNYPTSTDIYLNIENGTVEILNFTYNRLRFYNTFPYKSHEELAYFAAFVADELGMSPENLTLVLSGDVNTSDKGFTYLAEFFGKVRLNDIRVLTLPEQVAPHKILSLAALSLCASSEGN
ncbi:DUF3822 family protein [Mucilaginibacter pedocola]|uniref:DUF3822 domain-containing protein n=1 Tax=Mucilaginibacter pedocola TaxID=1792845 RepID=A0A1S9PMT2_9SPHI|nr:DUF3822 family protein [Mucilaginibacter pedocola]OOQ62250.1 hypothetical protein BC343_04185 [Mucilaginibacter pedocola]